MMSIVTPRPSKGDLVMAPIDSYFWHSSSGTDVYSLPGISQVSYSEALDTIDSTNVSTGRRAKIGGTICEGTITVSCNGITAAMLLGMLQMRNTTGGVYGYKEDDVAISSGYADLTDTPIDNKCLYVQDENYKYVDYLNSGTPSLGQYTISGTGFNVADSVDGVNYTLKYYASHTDGGNVLKFDFTKHPARALSMRFFAVPVDEYDGEPHYDASDLDKKSVNYLYVKKAHLISEVPMFFASLDSEHTYDLEFSVWANEDQDAVEVGFVDRVTTPTA